MRFTILALILAGCVDQGSTGTHTDGLKNCALLGNSQDLVCTDATHCAWRGQACVLDECGIAPSYPGYAASPQGDATAIKTDQWNALVQYMSDMQAFQACEVARQ